MATTTNDYAPSALEKQDTTYIEHAHDSPAGASLDLTQTKTLEGIDVHNRSALKGDDSDGKVEFGVRGALAAMFLAGLYTGKPILPPLDMVTISNVSQGSQVILYFTGGSLSFVRHPRR